MDTTKYLKRTRFGYLVREEKIALINAVKNQTCIWNNESKEYSDQMVVKRAWESVAKQLNKDANECKAAWNSLRDSLRYHRGKMTKSGSALVDWEFAQCMDFVPNSSSKRRTSKSKLNAHESQDNYSTSDSMGFKDCFEHFVLTESKESKAKQLSKVDDLFTENNLKQNRVEHLLREEKIALINAVKDQTCIWNTESKEYSNHVAIKRAWESVGLKLNKDELKCKAYWNTLKDCLRYHRRKVLKRKGSQSKTTESVDWEFAQYMDFLPNNSSKKRMSRRKVVENYREKSCSPCELSMDYLVEDTSTSVVNEPDPTSTSGPYNKPEAIEHEVNEQELSNKKLEAIIDRYLNTRKSSRNIFPFWNELLSKLPPSKATETEMEITNLIYAKVKAYEKNQNYS